MPIEGARTGAPDAIQVADRWHLWHNLGEAVEAVVVAHRAHLPEPPPATVEPATPATSETPPPAPTTDPVQPPESLPQKEIRLVTRTRERYAAVQALLAEGHSRTELVRRLGLDPQTVRRFTDASTVDELLANTRRESFIDTYTPYLLQRFQAGCTNATTLLEEIRGTRSARHRLRRLPR